MRHSPVARIGTDVDHITVLTFTLIVLNIDAVAQETGFGPWFRHGSGLVEKEYAAVDHALIIPAMIHRRPLAIAPNNAVVNQPLNVVRRE